MTVTFEQNEEELRFVAHGEEQAVRHQAGTEAPGRH